MTRDQMLARLRIRLNDTDAVEFNDAELEAYIDDAIQMIHAMRIQLKDPRIVTSATVDATLPSDWAAWVGQVPLEVSGTTVTGGPLAVRYYKAATLPSTGSSVLGAPAELLPSILNYAVLQGRIRLGLDIDQEEPQARKILQAVAAALGLPMPAARPYGTAR